tara:strand:+ start:539 stop:1213 length:675 start_codon:yes stop_codon:yes gene_type:complete
MNQIESLDELIQMSSEQISLPFTIINLILCLIVSMIIRSYYINYSNSLTGKLHVGQIIPILSSVVFLVIVIVKSSLALSLGLVGALSIVRFRTPIKEPEELVYLFLSISVGLGFGAGYSLITSIIVFLILLFNYVFLNQKKTIKSSEYNLVIERKSSDINFDELINSLSDFCNTVKFIRIDSENENHNIVLLVSIKSASSINDILKSLQKENTGVSFFESNTNW